MEETTEKSQKENIYRELKTGPRTRMPILQEVRILRKKILPETSRKIPTGIRISYVNRSGYE
jgi:hypothetical protein